MTLDTSQLIMTAVASAFALSTAAWGWLMRRWVARVDALHKDVAALERQAAVRDERMTHLIGAIEVLRRTVQDQAETIGVLKGVVDKFWDVLRAQGLLEARPSDEILSPARRGPRRQP